MSEAYHEPVAQLLNLGDPREMHDWPDYLALGLEMAHIPDLIRLAQEWGNEWWEEYDDCDEVWGPVHAWHALGQLRAESAIQPLMEILLRIDELDDDWSMEELPQVFGQIGLAAIPALSRTLADDAAGLWARVTAANCLECIGTLHPEARGQCVEAMSQVLSQFAHLDHLLNAFIVSFLVDLHAVEAALLMEQAFGAKCVDLGVQGDWEDVQIELGLLSERLTPSRNYFAEMLAGQKPRQKKANPKKKAKRKQQKASRKKNRKRRR